MSGCLLTLEGIEGTGKSTHLEFIVEYLRSQGKHVVATREPGGTEIGERIRALLLSKDLPAMHAETELLLMYAARIEHIKKVIEPALNAGSWVVSDRFFDATYAYQGYGRNLDLDRIDAINQFVIGELSVELTILLDVNLAVSHQRIDQRGQRDRFELEQDAFYEKVRAGYLQLAEQNKKRIHVIDATKTIQQVQADIQALLDKVLSQS